MLRLGYNTNGFAHHRLEDALILLADLGYQSVAITLDYHSLDPFSSSLGSQLTEVRALLNRYQLQSVIETGARFLLDPRRKHQPTLLSGGTDASRRLEFLKKSIDIAATLGSQSVSFWSGTPDQPRPHAELLNQLVAHCQELCRYASAANMRLAFEPEPGMFIDTMQSFAELHARVGHPAFGLTLDVGHLHCQGETPISDHLRTWRDWLWNIHIEDMRQGIHDHLLFGTGEIDFDPVLATLVEIGYSGGVHVELSRHSHNAVETARQALAFLRAHFPG